MKRLPVIIMILLIVPAASGQGRYAGSKKSLIGKVYTDSRNIEGLGGWKSLEGTILTRLDDPEMITVDVFQKGTTRIIFFSIKEDTSSNQFTIADVLEVKPVTTGWTIKTALCRQHKIANIWIVAWVRETSTEYLKGIKKAWRFNPDKRRVEIVSIKGIDCLNEGFDQY